MCALPFPSAHWSWLGRVPYSPTVQLQEWLREQVARGNAPNTLLMCEHDPVITLGRSAHQQNVLASAQSLQQEGVTLVHASRGGDVTYHGPGQLVGYPIFRLRRGVLAHITWMANALINVLAAYGIPATFRRDQPGVWVGAAKVCAFGVHVRHRVAIHGFALNVSPNMAHFNFIVPCGLHDRSVTSLATLLGRPALTVDEVLPLVVEALAAELDGDLEQIDARASREDAWLSVMASQTKALH